MARLNPSVFSRKHLRKNDKKTSRLLSRTPAMHGAQGLDLQRDPVHNRIRTTDRSSQLHKDTLRAARDKLGY
jgi:hypothetical protein